MNIRYYAVTFGADPEFFFKNKEGHIVGAEKVLPIDGAGIELHGDGTSSKPQVVIDGVQGEFNVFPATCRQAFSGYIRNCFLIANRAAQEHGLVLDFSQTVEVTEDEMASLSPKSQQFGCAPSLNVYGEFKIPVADSSKFFQRSAGGHIHIGGAGYSNVDKMLKSPKELIPMFDVLVGNTMVMLDRDAGNIERRKVYGRAGEYRLPSHGIEYRTLSNFWLRDYKLMSFVFGMARFAVNVAVNPVLSSEIMNRVDMTKIQKAINENDFDLAVANFNAIKDVVRGVAPGMDASPFFPLQGARMEKFEYFVEQGLDSWFKEDPLRAWTQAGALDNGWERFIDRLNVEQVPAKSPVQLDLKTA